MDKSPPNIVRMRFFQAIFSPFPTYFVVVVRHPFDVLRLSDEKPIDEMVALLKNWVACYERARDDSKQLHNVLWLKFEELVSAPRNTIQSTFRFLGLPPARTHIARTDKVRKVAPNRFGFIGDPARSQIVIYPTEAYAYRKLIPVTPVLRSKLKDDLFVTEMKSQEKRVEPFGYSLQQAWKEMLSIE